jgi:hypothetical protein
MEAGEEAAQIPAEVSRVPLEQEPGERQQPVTAALLLVVVPARRQLEEPAHSRARAPKPLPIGRNPDSRYRREEPLYRISDISK